MRELLRDFLPPIVARAYRKVAGRAFAFRGDHATWEAARAASSGYDGAAILASTREAALKVKRGEARMDRDGVVFDHLEYSFPVLAGLLRAVRAGGSSLNVLDIGGSLGSVYRQFRAFSPRLGSLRWNIVEQPTVVASGREHFEDGELRFFPDIASALAAGSPDVLLISSALQYFEAPYALIEELAEIKGACLVIDRTPCADSDRDVLAVQSVPSEIYSGSYPCWILSRRKLEAALEKHYLIAASFRDPAGPLRGDRGAFELQGYVLDAKG